MVTRRVLFGILGAVILTLGAVVTPSLYSTAVLGSGFLAQLLCSSTFVSHRDPQAVVAEDMSGPGYELVPLFKWRLVIWEEKDSGEAEIGKYSPAYPGFFCGFKVSNIEFNRDRRLNTRVIAVIHDHVLCSAAIICSMPYYSDK